MSSSISNKKYASVSVRELFFRYRDMDIIIDSEQYRYHIKISTLVPITSYYVLPIHVTPLISVWF